MNKEKLVNILCHLALKCKDRSYYKDMYFFYKTLT